MFRDIESQDFFYLVGLANHETVVLAESPNEAASVGAKKILKKNGNDTNVSMAIVVTKIKENTDDCEVFSFSEILVRFQTHVKTIRSNAKTLNYVADTINLANAAAGAVKGGWSAAGKFYKLGWEAKKQILEATIAYDDELMTFLVCPFSVSRRSHNASFGSKKKFLS